MIQPYEVRPGKCNNLNNEFDDSSKKIVRRLSDLCARIFIGKVNENDITTTSNGILNYIYSITL